MGRSFVDCISFMIIVMMLSSSLIALSSTGDHGLDGMVISDRIYDGSRYFLENTGQWDEELSFTAKTDFGHVGFGPGTVYYNIITDAPSLFDLEENDPFEIPDERIDKTCSGVVIRLDLGTGIAPQGCDPLDHASSIFNSRCDDGKAFICSNFGSIIFEDAWPGIDIHYYFTSQGLKYDILLKDGSDPDSISIEVHGVDSLIINNGILDLGSGELIFLSEKSPVAFDRDGRIIDCSFKLIDEDSYGFDLPEMVDHSGIIIDPLVASTYLGGSDEDLAYGITIDGQNNKALSGITTSWDFPTSTGCYDSTNHGVDVFVTKLNSDLSAIMVSTFICGDDWDYGRDIQTDSENNIYLVGQTYSTDYPTTPGAFNRTHWGDEWDIDVVATKLDPDCTTLLFSTYIAGEEDEIPNGMILREDGRMMIAGITTSDLLPVTSDAIKGSMDDYMDGYFMILDEAGSSLDFSTYLGGNDRENIMDMAVLDDDHPVMTGFTESSDLATSSEAYCNHLKGDGDSFVCILDLSTKTIQYQTYFGGGEYEESRGVNTSPNGTIIISGITDSYDLPTTGNAFSTDYNGGDSDGFVAVFDPGLSDLHYSSYFGGSDDERPYEVSLGSDGIFSMSGVIDSTDMSVTPDALQPVFQGCNNDGFIIRASINSPGKIYSSYIGGDGDDYLFLDMVEGGAHLLGGSSNSTNIPTTSGGVYTSNNGNADGFILMMDFTGKPTSPRDPSYHSGNDYINVTWSPPVFNGDSHVHQYKVYRKQGTSTIETDITDPDSMYYNDTTVEQYVRYTYWITAINSEGESPESSLIFASTRSIPTPPRNLTINKGPKQATLTWESPEIEGGSSITDYLIMRSRVGLGFEEMTKVDGAELSYVDIFTEYSEEFTYAIRARNMIGTSEPSNEVTITTPSLPVTPADVRIESGDSYNHLYWNAPESENEFPVLCFEIKWGYENDALDFINTIPVTDTQLNFTFLENGREYYYSVYSRSEVGLSEPGPIVMGVPSTVPDAPYKLAYTSGVKFVNISWIPPVDNGGLEITSYVVLRTSGTEEDAVYSVPGNMEWFNDTGFTYGVPYHYYVSARNGKGLSEPEGIRVRGVVAPPSPPRDPDITVMWNHVHILCQEPAEMNGGVLSGYEVYRSEGFDEWKLMPGYMADGFNDTTVVEGVTYDYRVTASNKGGESEPLEIPGILIPFRPLPPFNITATSHENNIVLQWEHSPSDNYQNNATGNFRIYRSKKGVSGTDLIASISTDLREFEDPYVALGKTYEYSIVSEFPAGLSEQSEKVMIEHILPPPPPLNVMTEIIDGNVVLRWDHPGENMGSRINAYLIYRSEGDGAEILFDEVASNLHEYVDEEVKPGREYHYTIVARNGAGAGERSETISVNIEKESNCRLIALAVGIIVAILTLVAIMIVIFFKLRKMESDYSSQSPDRDQ